MNNKKELKQAVVYSMTPDEAVRKLEYIASSSVFSDVKMACKMGMDAILILNEKKKCFKEDEKCSI